MQTWETDVKTNMMTNYRNFNLDNLMRMRAQVSPGFIK